MYLKTTSGKVPHGRQLVSWIEKKSHHACTVTKGSYVSVGQSEKL